MINLQQQDGLFPEYGKCVYRFGRTIKEACDGFAGIDLTEDEHIDALDIAERTWKPLMVAMMIFALLAIAADVLTWN